jgi:hypothetical protein
MVIRPGDSGIDNFGDRGIINLGGWGTHNLGDLPMRIFGNSTMQKFGVFVWELISKQPPSKHGEVSHLVLFLVSIVNFLFTQLIVQLLGI